jgi:hypothetical protein
LVSQGAINLVPLEERQKTSLISNLVAKLATPSTFDYIAQEIRSIQENKTIWYCPICKPEEFNQDNWILSTATAAKELKIQICSTDCQFQAKNANNSIGLLFNKKTKTLKKSAVKTAKVL